MRKNILAMSIAAMVGGLGLAGAANAGVSIAGTGGTGNLSLTTATSLNVTPNGIGHILLVPYFTTQNGNSTLLSVVNTDTVNGKAVKVRFRGAANSDDIFDFQVLMSPGDVWTANVSQGADGKSKLSTSDKSCTLPANVNASFVTDRLQASLSDAAKAEQTREGYVEIFNMADIPPTTALFTAIKHSAGVPSNCAAAAVTTGLATDPTSEADAVARGLNTPTTGLTGGWTIVNLKGAAVAWSDKATAIIAGTTVADLSAGGRGRLVFSPQKADAASNVNNLTNDPLFRIPTVGTAKVQAANYDLPDLSTPYTGVAALMADQPSIQANVVGGAIAATSVVNEFLTDASITAKTDWVFSAPTRRYAVAMDYAAGAALFSTQVVTAPMAVASNFYTSANTAKGTGASASLICVQPGGGSLSSYDREETTSATGFVISPGTATKLEFCGETSVLSFNAGGASAASVLGATIARKDVEVGYSAGWSSIPTPGLGMGLPVLGNAFVSAVGSPTSNFSITHGHRFTK